MTIKKGSAELLASAARTATPSAVVLDDTTLRAAGGRLSGFHVIIDVTAVTATPSVVPVIEAKDEVSGKFYPLLTGSAITGVGTTVLQVGRDVATVANLSQQNILPTNMRVTFTHADADSITYSVGMNFESEL